MARTALTAAQRRGLAAAMAASAKAFRKAQRELPVGSTRRAGFAAQAVDFLASVDALGIDRTDPHCKVYVRQGLANIAAHDRDVAAEAASA